MRALTPKRILTIRFFQCGIFYFLCCINHATIVLKELCTFHIGVKDMKIFRCFFFNILLFTVIFLKNWKRR